jgi:hypothetical protein
MSRFVPVFVYAPNRRRERAYQEGEEPRESIEVNEVERAVRLEQAFHEQVGGSSQGAGNHEHQRLEAYKALIIVIFENPPGKRSQQSAHKPPGQVELHFYSQRPCVYIH